MALKQDSGHYDGKALLKRIFKHRRIDPQTGCWLWVGAKSHKYGLLWFNYKGSRVGRTVHRIMAWMYLDYEPMTGLVVCHRCNVQACFNPDHLYLATPQQNTADAFRDGLMVGHKKGSEHYEAKLTEAQVREIRALHLKGFSQKSLAREHGVHVSTIKDITHRRTWKHLDDRVLQ